MRIVFEHFAEQVVSQQLFFNIVMTSLMFVLVILMPAEVVEVNGDWRLQPIETIVANRAADAHRQHHE